MFTKRGYRGWPELRNFAIATTALFCCAAIGCFGLGGYQYAKYDVIVVDGETAQPVPGAVVFTPVSQGADSDETNADARGHAVLRMARHVGGGVYARAEGYMTSVPVGGGDAGPNGTKLTVALFRPPEPLAGITIPAGFRGMLHVREGAEPQLPSTMPARWPPATREFYTPANISGLTILKPLPKLFNGQPYAARVWTARFDDGRPLRYENPIEAQGTSGEFKFLLPDMRDRVPPAPDGTALFDLGLRADYPVTWRDYCEIYFVGTESEAKAAQDALVRGALPADVTTRPSKQRPSSGYDFRPKPLSGERMPTSAELSPRGRH